ncbi:hypothetical protein TI03_01630 [Achromatium sp. WMS1]|nr:hypothetical protein TI03_01630 [Achromatium sp. WMS1]
MQIKWLTIALILIVLTLDGCQSSSNNHKIASTVQHQPVNVIKTPTTTKEQTIQQPSKTVKRTTESKPTSVTRQLPQITQEPLIAVYLKRGSLIVLTLARDGVVTVNNTTINIPKGKLKFKLTANGIVSNVTGSQTLGDRVYIKVPYLPDTATFRTKVFPPFGKPERLAFIGEPEILYDPLSRKLILVELVGLEDYLRGVLPTEISPKWPLEAIKAQAVVARSYTLDRYLRRFDQIWHLHWHFTVDMAYSGLKQLNYRMAVALKQTRGQLITTNKLPVPAFFHACSGGRTENGRNFRPELMGADGVTSVLQVMPSVNDPYAIRGARSLNLLRTHIDWQTTLSLSEVNIRLHKWMREHPDDRIPLGKVQSVHIGERFYDSERLKTVLIRHTLNNQKVETALSATMFRLAVGPGKVRSTNWQSCVLSTDSKSLLIRGQGYGHGVGLSQVSAYQMAQEGHNAGNIVRYFYPNAKLTQWWQ